MDKSLSISSLLKCLLLHLLFPLLFAVRPSVELFDLIVTLHLVQLTKETHVFTPATPQPAAHSVQPPSPVPSRFFSPCQISGRIPRAVTSILVGVSAASFAFLREKKWDECGEIPIYEWKVANGDSKRRRNPSLYGECRLLN